MAEIGTFSESLHQELRELSLRPVVRVPAGATLRAVAAVMRHEDVSSALIGDSQREIVTERDLTRAVASGLGPDDPVEAIVERTPVWATTTSHVADAASMMLDEGVRHLIVLDIEGQAVGVVSMREIFALLVPGVPHRRVPTGTH